MRRECTTTYGDAESPTSAVVDAIAQLADLDPDELDFVLYDYVNPDALDDLLARQPRQNGGVEVEFVVSGFEVTVRNDGTVTARRPDAASSASRPEARPATTGSFKSHPGEPQRRIDYR